MTPLLDARKRRNLVSANITESVVMRRQVTLEKCGHTVWTLLREPQVPAMCPECWVSLELGS